MTTAGQNIVSQLAAHGARRVFCVAGESYLPVLDALLDYPDIDVVTCRQEGGAAFMAEAYGAMTGEPGIAMVTRGPGACNAAIGVHTAMQSSMPMIVFVGLIAQGDRDKEAFQEFDIKQMFGSLSKWVITIDQPERAAEYVARAWHVATSGRPGPVVLGLPEDMLAQEAGEAPVKPVALEKSGLSPAHIAKINEMLGAAQRPVVIAGGSYWSNADCENLSDYASAAHLPVTTAFRCQDVFPHKNSNYVGELGTGPNPQLITRVQEADVILAIGTRLDEITQQSYTLLQPDQKLIHITQEAQDFGKSVAPDIAIAADTSLAVAALAGGTRPDGRRWAGWKEQLRAEYVEWSTPQPRGGWQGADMTAIYAQLQELLPADAIVTTDAGNFSGWAQRYLRYGRPGRLLAPVSGAMGYSVPASISAALEHSERIVLGICGDGGFMMNGQELATALDKGAKPIIMVCNNAIYGTIHMHQDRDFPGRSCGVTLTNPDFVALAQAHDMFAACITDAQDFPRVWEEAQNSGKAALIEIQMDPRQLSTRSKV